MSNGGGEYQSKVFHRMLADQGIELLLLPPHTPQINGRAEHFMRTLTEKADTMCCRLERGQLCETTHKLKISSSSDIGRL
jgi:transposase InsO family protein